MGDPIKGKFMRLKFGTKKLWHATECALDSSRDTEETSSKDTTGKVISLGDYGYTLSTSALYAMLADGDTTSVSSDDMMALYFAGTIINWTFTSPDSEKIYSGTCYVTSANLTATNGSNSQTSFTFTGTGDIVIADVTP